MERARWQLLWTAGEEICDKGVRRRDTLLFLLPIRCVSLKGLPWDISTERGGQGGPAQSEVEKDGEWLWRNKWEIFEQPTLLENISSVCLPLHSQGSKGNALWIYTDYDSVLWDLIETVCVWLTPSTSLSLIFMFVKCGWKTCFPRCKRYCVDEDIAKPDAESFRAIRSLRP